MRVSRNRNLIVFKSINCSVGCQVWISLNLYYTVRNAWSKQLICTDRNLVVCFRIFLSHQTFMSKMSNRWQKHRTIYLLSWQMLRKRSFESSVLLPIWGQKMRLARELSTTSGKQLTSGFVGRRQTWRFKLLPPALLPDKRAGQTRSSMSLEKSNEKK